MADEQNPDICVIGGGAGGIAVATAAAQANVPVVLVEKAAIGGANLSMAMPAKSFIAAADRYAALRSGPALGVTGAPLQVNFGKVHEHIQSVKEAAAANVSAERLTALGVTVIRETARFTDERTVVAGDITVRARLFVVAAGTTLQTPDVTGLAGVNPLTLQTMFDTPRKMTHLLVLGAGRRGLELAQAYSRLGVDTTVIDQKPALADDDPELSAIVIERLKAEGIRIRDTVTIESVAKRRGGIRVMIGGDEGGEESAVDGSHLLVASGSAPDIDDLGLDKAGIAYDSSGIAVNRRLRTTNRHVYAIGDCIAGSDAENRATCQAQQVFRSIVHRRSDRDAAGTLASLALTDPALAAVGLSETAAREAHKDVHVLRLPFTENDLALSQRTTSGLIKVIATREGQILGATVVGRDAGETIGLFSLALARRLNLDALREFQPPYPSRTEAARQVASALNAPSLTPLWQRRIIEFLRKLG